MLQPGQMDQVVTLLKQTTVRDALGQHTQWTTIADVAARVKPLRGNQFFSAGQMQNPATLQVEVYWRIDVTAAWRLRWMTRLYELVAEPIDVEARHEVLELMCKAVPL